MSTIDYGARGVAFPAGKRAGIARVHPRLLLLVAILCAAALGQLTALAKFRAVWSSGAFFDTDDAMRAVQMRDLAAGQGWFDMTAYRLDPPDGVFMHWSRVIDAPLLLLSKGFGLFTDPATAERLTRLAFPLLLTVAFFVLVVCLCERLLGRSVRYPALAAAFFYGPATGQFEPGRIDHHAPQIVLLVGVAAALAHALTTGRPKAAWLAGAALALSMAISVENVPFFAALLAALVLLWTLDGARVSALLAWFAAGLVVALPLVYAATIAPSRWMIVASDALSLAQAVTLLSASAFLFILAGCARWLPDSRRVRLGLAVAGGFLFAFPLTLAFPALAGSPFAHLDPLLHRFWLDGVDEAQPVLRKFVADPLWTTGILAPAAIGFAGTLWSGSRTSIPVRRVWLILAIMLAGGLAASFMMVRTIAFVLALGVPGALALALAARAHLAARHNPAFAGPLATLVLILSLSSVGWAAACNQMRRLAPAPADGAQPVATVGSRSGFAACTAPKAFAALARLPAGRVLAEPDLGAYILAHTRHSVVAGAYHRNEHGMRDAIIAFMAPPAEVQARVARTGADYVLYCHAAVDPQLVEASPDGLAAQLMHGNVPDWLRHLDADGSALDVYVNNMRR